jgi:hypothetical protein
MTKTLDGEEAALYGVEQRGGPPQLGGPITLLEIGKANGRVEKNSTHSLFRGSQLSLSLL